MNDLTPKEAEEVRRTIDWALLIGIGVTTGLTYLGYHFAPIAVGLAFSLLVFEGTLFLMTR